MSNKSPFASPRLKAQRSSRNSFDLGHKFAFNASMGEIVPICHIDVPAGSYVEIGEENQTYNLNPIVRPAFSRLKEHIDYFAVPKVQLWSLYDNFITGQSQFMSSALGDSFLAGSRNSEEVPQQVPMFNAGFLGKVLGVKSQTQNPFGVSQLNDTLKLLNYLGYGNFYGILGSGIVEYQSAQDVEVTFGGKMDMIPQNFFNLLAYQKIYYSYYRNSKYERNIPTAYNMDWLPKSKLNLTDTDFVENDFIDIFTLHHRWLNKDYFMSSSPSVLPSTSDIGFNGLQSSLQDSTTVWQIFSLPGSPALQTSAGPFTSTVSANNLGQTVVQRSNVSSNVTTNSVSAIRFAFAYDKLLRRMRTAGATFDDQMLAQFGIKPVDYRHGDAYYLGGYTNRLNVSEVTDTSSADINSLGQFGANISKYSSNKRKISYKAKEDVIIMGIYSTSYDVDYPSSRYDRDNIKRFRFDFFNPAFENLGLQALYTGELSMASYNTGSGDIEDGSLAVASDTTKLLAYNKRYLEYKTKVDTVAGLMDYIVNNSTAMSWTTQYRPYIIDQGLLVTNTQKPLDMSMMLVNPIIMNDIYTNNYSSAWQNDHFICNLYNDIKMVANMSIDGEVY